jgi:hypothetical protein
MPNTTTTENNSFEECARRVREAREACDDLAETLRAMCDDPAAARCQLDELAATCYHAGEYRGIPGPCGRVVQSLRALGNRAWSIVDQLDRLREEADELAGRLACAQRAADHDAAVVAAV